MKPKHLFVSISVQVLRENCKENMECLVNFTILIIRFLSRFKVVLEMLSI